MACRPIKQTVVGHMHAYGNCTCLENYDCEHSAMWLVVAVQKHGVAAEVPVDLAIETVPATSLAALVEKDLALARTVLERCIARCGSCVHGCLV
jgi:hypothetical protein